MLNTSETIASQRGDAIAEPTTWPERREACMQYSFDVSYLNKCTSSHWIKWHNTHVADGIVGWVHGDDLKVLECRVLL
jgi:hypothetical protein